MGEDELQLEELPAIQWQQSPEDLWNLLSLSQEELSVIYPDRSWESLKKRKGEFNRLIKEGKLTMPPKNPEYDGNPEAEAERANSRRRVSQKTGQVALSSFITKEQRAKLHAQLDKAIDEYGTSMGKVTFTEWEMGFSTGSGDEKTADSIPLHSTRVEVKFDTEPEWLPVTRVESLILPKRESKKDAEQNKTAIILPDMQIGYRTYSDGTSEPFHDEKAISIALQVLIDTKPDKVILLGDLLDLQEFSRYEQSPEFARTTQLAINYAHKLLVAIRKASPAAEIVMLEGNHSRRLEKHVKSNALAAFGLKRADQPNGWPVLSVPYLLAFDQLDVEYIGGYPANRYWINERLQARHGDKARTGASTAKAIADDERVSTIFGHIHRIETHYKTVNVYGGARTSFAHTPGTLSRIDGAVPSTKGSTHLDGRPVENYENWQSGFCVISYLDGDSPFSLEQVYINSVGDYESVYRDKKYLPNQQIIDLLKVT